MAVAHVYPPPMSDGRIALDARGELGPALLLHLSKACAGTKLKLGRVLTRPWSRAEDWRLSVEGGARLALGHVDGELVVQGARCTGVGHVAIGADPELAASAVVVATSPGLVPAPRFRPQVTQGTHAMASGHAQALAGAVALISSRLDLRWMLVDLHVRPDGEPVELDNLERSCGGFAQLAGKISLRQHVGSADRERLAISANFGGAPGQVGVIEALGDAMASPHCLGRVIEASSTPPPDTLRGHGQLAWLSEQTHAVGPMARFVFDYDARDLRAARMVELAIALLSDRNEG